MYCQARIRAFTKKNILSAFKATDVWPLNPDIIDPKAFGPSEVLLPHQSNNEATNESSAALLDPQLYEPSISSYDIENAIKNPQQYSRNQLADLLRKSSQQLDSLKEQNYLQDQHNENLYSQLRRVSTKKKKNRRSLPFAKVWTTESQLKEMKDIQEARQLEEQRKSERKEMREKKREEKRVEKEKRMEERKKKAEERKKKAEERKKKAEEKETVKVLNLQKTEKVFLVLLFI
jgi:hypothetical protein